MSYTNRASLCVLLGLGIFFKIDAMEVKEKEIKNKEEVNNKEHLLELGKLDAEFRKINGIASPLLDKKKTMDTLKRIAISKPTSHTKFFKNVSEGASIYYDLVSGKKTIPTDQKTLYKWCCKVLTFIYAHSFIQRASHDGPTDALFVIEGGSDIKQLFDAYCFSVLPGVEERIKELKKSSNYDEASLISELNTKKNKLKNNRIVWSGADGAEGSLYGARIQFRKTEEQSHRKPLIGRFKEVCYSVLPGGDVVFKFYGESLSKVSADINLSSVPQDCKEYFKTNFGSSAEKEHGSSLRAMQDYVDQLIEEKSEKADKASSFKQYLKRYAVKKRLTHFKKRMGNELRIDGKFELLTAAYLMQDPCIFAQDTTNESSSLIFDNKASTEFSQIRGLFIMVQNFLDTLDNVYKKDFLENLQPGDEIPLSNELQKTSICGYTSVCIDTLSSQMRTYCICYKAIVPSLKDENVRTYFARAEMMIEKLLTDYRKNPQYVFESQFFDSDSQIDFATQGIKTKIMITIDEFYKKATKMYSGLPQSAESFEKIAVTWKDLIKRSLDENKEQPIATNSFRDVIKQVLYQDSLKTEIPTDWPIFKEKCSLLLNGGDKNEHLMLLDTAIKNILGDGDRSFIFDIQAFDSDVAGIFTQAVKKQKILGGAILALVLKQIKQDGLNGELRSKIENTANSWKSYLQEIALQFENAGFYVSCGKKGSVILEGIKLYVEKKVQETMSDKSDKILPLVRGKFIQDKLKVYVAFGDDAFKSRIYPGYNELVSKGSL